MYITNLLLQVYNTKVLTSVANETMNLLTVACNKWLQFHFPYFQFHMVLHFWLTAYYIISGKEFCCQQPDGLSNCCWCIQTKQHNCAELGSCWACLVQLRKCLHMQMPPGCWDNGQGDGHCLKVEMTSQIEIIVLECFTD